MFANDGSLQVVLLVIDVHACIAEDPPHFRQLVVFLVHNFRVDNSLLEKWVSFRLFLALLSLVLLVCNLNVLLLSPIIQSCLFFTQAWCSNNPSALCTSRCWKGLSWTLNHTRRSIWPGFCIYYGSGSVNYLIIV